MCKILCLTKHDPLKLKETVVRVWADMKTTERDGYGATWFGENGEIGWVKTRWPVWPDTDIPNFVQGGFHAMKDIPSDGGFLLIHGRAASSTCPITLANTHPMLTHDGKMALIHNGFVYSSMGYYKNSKDCSCDSELLMFAYDAGGIDEITRNIGGSFAFMTLRLEEGKKTLHIAKDDKKSLYCGKTADGYAIGTSLHLFDQVDAAPIGEYKNYQIVIFGRQDKIEMSAFEPYKVGGTYDALDDDKAWQYQKPITHKPYIPPLPNVIVLPDLSDQDEITKQEREPLPL